MKGWKLPKIISMILFCLQENKITSRKADVLQAAYFASEVAHRTVKPGEEVSTNYLATSNTVHLFTIFPDTNTVLLKTSASFDALFFILTKNQQYICGCQTFKVELSMYLLI